jgi:hypothetical protein
MLKIDFLVRRYANGRLIFGTIGGAAPYNLGISRRYNINYQLSTIDYQLSTP